MRKVSNREDSVPSSVIHSTAASGSCDLRGIHPLAPTDTTPRHGGIEACLRVILQRASGVQLVLVGGG